MLSQFRDRLIGHAREAIVLDAILERCRQAGLLRVGRRVRTDSTHVVGCIRDLNRLELVTEKMRCALEALAVTAPDWLTARTHPHHPLPAATPKPGGMIQETHITTGNRVLG